MLFEVIPYEDLKLVTEGDLDAAEEALECLEDCFFEAEVQDRTNAINYLAVAFVERRRARANQAGFADHLAEVLGTPKWVVAVRLTAKLRAKGYEVAVSPARYQKLQDAWRAKQ